MPAADTPTGDGWARCRFPLRNTGRPAAPAGEHPEDVGAYLNSDVYRLTAAAESDGWSVWLPNRLATARFGGTTTADVYAKRAGGSRVGRIRLTATSQSNATKFDSATCRAVAR